MKIIHLQQKTLQHQMCAYLNCIPSSVFVFMDKNIWLSIFIFPHVFKKEKKKGNIREENGIDIQGKYGAENFAKSFRINQAITSIFTKLKEILYLQYLQKYLFISKSDVICRNSHFSLLNTYYKTLITKHFYNYTS